MIDVDNSGTLTKEEIKKSVKSDKEVIDFLKDCGEENLQFLLEPKRLDRALNALDTSQDGEVDVDEWEEAIQRGLKVRLAQLAEDRERRERAAAAEDGAFTAEFMAAARKVFDLIDTDASGLLDHDEIKTGVTSNQEVIAFVKDCGNQNLQDLLVPEKIEKSIKTLDTSGDGLIDAFEWEAIIEKALAAKLDERAKARAEEAIASGLSATGGKKRRRPAPWTGGGVELPLLIFGDMTDLNGGAKGNKSQKKKVSGAGARLCAAIEDEREECGKENEPLVLFTGNSFGASFEGTVTRGDHVVPTANAMGVYCGGVGPSDLDYGCANLERIANACNFPLLLSNVSDARTSKPLAGTQASRLVTWQGRKVGIIAVAAAEKLRDCATLEVVSGNTGSDSQKGSPPPVRVEDEDACVRRLGGELRRNGAEVVIVLAAVGGGTSKSSPGGELAVAANGMADVIVVSGPRGEAPPSGAHRHETDEAYCWVVRAPPQLACLLKMSVILPEEPHSGPPPHLAAEALNIAPGARAVDAVGRLAVVAHRGVARGLATTAAVCEGTLDCSAESLRGGRHLATRRAGASAGGLAADVAAAATRSDLAILDGRALRSVGELPPRKPLTPADLLALAPIADSDKDGPRVEEGAVDVFEGDDDDGVKVDDSLDGIAQQACDGPGLVVVEATGLQIRVALELALARYPNLSDDFPHVSDDVRVIFRPDERPGRRIGKEGLFFEGKGMLKTRTYRVCTTARFARRAFLGSKAPHGAATVAVPAREGPLLVTLLRNLFADCTKSDGDSAPRALAAPVYARMRKGDAPWLRPRGGGLKICPPAGGRIAVEGEGFGGEGGDGTRLPPIESPTRGRAPPPPRGRTMQSPLPPPAGPRTPLAQSRYYNPDPRSLAKPKPLPGTATQAMRGSFGQSGLAPLPDLAINRTGSPVRLIGGIGLALHDPLPVGSIDQYSASTRAIELARRSAELSRDMSPDGRPRTTMGGSPTRSPSPARPRTTMGSPGGW